MARRCIVCDKGTKSGHNVSHSQRKTNRVWVPNLQRIRVMVGNTPKRAYVCTTCIKSGKVERAI